jgi:hypothetical protein
MNKETLQSALRTVNRRLSRAEEALESRSLSVIQLADIRSEIVRLEGEQDGIITELDLLGASEAKP